MMSKSEDKGTDESSVESRNLIEPLRHLFTRVHGSAKNNRIWLDVWSNALAIDKDDTTIYAVMNLISRGVENAARRINHTQGYPKNTARLAIAVLRNCGEYLKPSRLHEPCGEGRPNFSQEKMDILLVAGEALEMRFTEPKLSKAQKDDLLALVDQMERLLDSGSLHPILVDAIRPHLRMIRWAVIQYDVIGIDGLLRSCTEMWIDLRRVDDEASNKETEEFKDAFEKFWQYVNRADQLVRIAEAGYSATVKALEFFDSFGKSGG